MFYSLSPVGPFVCVCVCVLFASHVNNCENRLYEGANKVGLTGRRC